MFFSHHIIFPVSDQAIHHEMFQYIVCVTQIWSVYSTFLSTNLQIRRHRSIFFIVYKIEEKMPVFAFL